MEGGLRCRRGGIRGLLELIHQHREAIEYDLIALGLRLDWIGSDRLTWRDLWVIVQRSPASSALTRARDPEAAQWDTAAQLLAGIFDTLQVANWQRGPAKRRDFPKPLARPGVEPDTANLIGSGAGIPMDEMARRLGWTDRTEGPHE